MEDEFGAWVMGIFVEVVDAGGVEERGAALDAVDFVAFAEEELGEVSAVLAGDSCDEGFLQRGASVERDAAIGSFVLDLVYLRLEEPGCTRVMRSCSKRTRTWSATEVLNGITAGGGAEGGAKFGGVDEVADGFVEGLRVFGGDDEAAGFGVGIGDAADDVGDLGAGVGGGEDGAAAGEHAGEFGGHDKVGGSGALGEEMDVGGVEEVVELVEGLEGEEGNVFETGDRGFELGTEAAVAAEEEVDLGVGGEVLGERSEELEALFVAHVTGVKQDDFVFET